MCGILGTIHFDQKPADGQRLHDALQWMHHRGPDDEGVWKDGSVGLAHKRLSILDLSSAGHQPMLSSDGEAVIVYNGECYNFKSLREDLIAKGHLFRSGTDTEVVLNGLREYGPDFVLKMNGMFAFAVWFRKEKFLYIFRDRLGIKPLYYYRDTSKLYFSSEIKPLLSLGVAPKLEESMVSTFFSLRYCSGEKTLFKGINKLAPGHFLKIHMNGIFEDKTYWDLLNQKEIEPLSERAAQEEFYRLLDDAVKMRQVADVPVGAFLSGGIDSSAIVALMKKNSDAVETFTFGMGADIDESKKAKEVAKALGVHNDLLCLKKDDYQYYEKALWHLEEPLGDSIIVPTYLLAQRTAKKVKVVELGEGADEILGGYVHQLAMTYGHMMGRVFPKFLLQKMPVITDKIPQFFWEKMFPYPAKLGSSGVARIASYLSSLDSFGDAYLNLVGLFNESEKRSIFNQEFYENSMASSSPVERLVNYHDQSQNKVFQNRLLQADLRYWNTDYSMLRMDKLTMAHSLEARVPFLDYRLVELCLRLPRQFKTKGFKQKRLLRRALANKNILPDEIINAPKKSFYLPIEKCFDHRFKDFIRESLNRNAMKGRGIYNMEQLDAFLNEETRELIGNKQIMAIFAFELWGKLFLDGGWKQKQEFPTSNIDSVTIKEIV